MSSSCSWWTQPGRMDSATLLPRWHPRLHPGLLGDIPAELARGAGGERGRAGTAEQGVGHTRVRASQWHIPPVTCCVLSWEVRTDEAGGIIWVHFPPVLSQGEPGDRGGLHEAH